VPEGRDAGAALAFAGRIVKWVAGAAYLMLASIGPQRPYANQPYKERLYGSRHEGHAGGPAKQAPESA
jgi:hypothetical protein